MGGCVRCAEEIAEQRNRQPVRTVRITRALPRPSLESVLDRARIEQKTVAVLIEILFGPLNPPRMLETRVFQCRLRRRCRMAEPERDVFLCHAGEDKDSIVRPLYRAFTDAGISCWYDEAEIPWGHSITQKVNEGLRTSRFTVAILSKASAHKHWPQRELCALMNQEAASGAVRILPLIAGSDQDAEEILKQSPLLNDKRYLRWNDDPIPVVKEMLACLGRHGDTHSTDSVQPESAAAPQVYIPRTQRRFSQRDKDLFLHGSFAAVKRYFAAGLKSIETQYEDIETSFDVVSASKFLATIYFNGEVANRCKIWIGGLSSQDSIGYYASPTIPDGDDSFNDILTVLDGSEVLAMTPSGMWTGRTSSAEKSELSPQETAEYLWRRFVEPLE